MTTPSKGSGDGSGDASRIWNAIMNPNSPESERQWAREQVK